MRHRGAVRIGKSDRVATLLPNCFELVAAWFAVSNLGAIEVPNNTGLKGDLLVPFRRRGRHG